MPTDVTEVFVSSELAVENKVLNTPSGNLPQTGYNSYLLYLIPLLVLSLGGAVITARRVARKR